jgi:hypothetical protein
VTAALYAYMDESGTHATAPFLTVAAYIATPADWQEWAPEWQFMNFPIKVFHSTDCNARQGEFDGWSREIRDQHVRGLLSVIANRPIAGCVIGLDMVAFDSAMKNHPELRRMFSTPYIACFQWVIQTIMDFANRMSGGRGASVSFFHENNDYEMQAHKAFKWLKEGEDPKKVLGSLTFNSKQAFVPLQAADILAYEGFRVMQNPERPRPSWEALQPKQKIMALNYNANNMHKLVLALSDIRDGNIPVEGQRLTAAEVDRLFPAKKRDSDK